MKYSMKPLKMADILHKTRVETVEYRKNIPFVLHTPTIGETDLSEPDFIAIKTGTLAKS